MSDPIQQTTPAPHAGMYADARWRAAILDATPPEVWAAYIEDGYTLRQAVEMEMSYAG